MELSFEMAAAFIIQGGCTVEGSMNIFITSVGRRTKLLEYFKKELEGKGRLIAGDCSKLAPALYTADKHYIVPRIDHPEYIDCIMNICRQENIKGILSLIDPNCPYWQNIIRILYQSGLSQSCLIIKPVSFS